LSQIKGLGEEAQDALVLERDNRGPYRSVETLVRRTDIDPSDVRLLVRAGAFDSIAQGANRPELMWQLAEWKQGRALSKRRTPSLFDQELAPPPRSSPYDDRKALLDEVETLGFLLSRHPLTLYRDKLRGQPIIEGRNMSRHVGREVQMVGWWVTGKVIATKDEEPMEFVSFEDTTALYETTFFPRAYAKFCHMLNRRRPYLLRGRVEEDFGVAQLVVDDARLL
jgi:error-prone DNA polymerase